VVADTILYINEMREAIGTLSEERQRLDNEVLQLKAILTRVLYPLFLNIY